MKLYYAPGACSLSPHIVLREAGYEFELERVDLATKTTEAGADYAAINPKGYVPALQLADGEVLTEGAAIIQFLADHRPQASLAPAGGSVPRAHLNGHLNFIATELHKAFGPLFNPAASDADRAAAPANVARRFDQVERALADGRPYLMGQSFTIADAYLFAIANWAKFKDIALDPWPKLAALMDRIAQRPAVKAALAAEGLA